MHFWRISKNEYALDRIGIGAMRKAGRWNKLNIPVIYAGTTVEIAAFEKLVHVEGALLPDDLVLVKITLPDDAPILTPDINDLPENWDAMPSSNEAKEFGTRFVQENQYVGLIVPSAIIPEARNIIINTNHPEWAKGTMEIVRPFPYDERLWKSAEA